MAVLDVLPDGIEWNALLAELGAIGHSYVEATRLPRFAKQAARDLLLEDRWLQRWVQEIPDGLGRIAGLGQIESVTHNGRPLPFQRYDALLPTYGPQMTATGVPELYYTRGFEELATWPVVAPTTLLATHWTRHPWATLVNAVPTTTKAPAADAVSLLGAEFDDALILRCRVLILEDTDEAALRDAYAQRYVDQLNHLRDEFLSHNADVPEQIDTNESSWA